MQNSVTEGHLYAREPIDPSGTDSLAVIARMITAGSTVLDVGCSTGELGRYLTNSKDCIVDGLDYNPVALSVAKAHYRSVALADLNQDRIDSLIGSQTYNYIVCADVLEHLLDPSNLLDQLKEHLTDSGQIIFSVPNVTYIGVVVELLFGKFNYRDDGILDRTHLHFFTKDSFTEFLIQHQLRVDSAVDIQLDLAYSEFSHYLLSDFSHKELKPLLDRPDALTYQFVLATTIADSESSNIPPSTIARHDPPRLEIGLSWKRSDDEAFRTSNRTVQPLSIGSEGERFRFDVGDATAKTILALDTANQPGYLSVLDISLWQNELLLWQHSYTGDRSLAEADPTLIDPRHDRGMRSSLASISTTRDDRIELPIPPSLLGTATALEVTISWYTLREYLLSLRDQIVRMEHQNSHLWTQVATSGESNKPTEASDLRRQLRRSEERLRYEILYNYLNIQQINATLVAREQSHAGEVSQLIDQLEQRELKHSQELAQLDALKVHLSERDQLLAELYASTSWRLSEPLRSLGARIPQPLRRLLSAFIHQNNPANRPDEDQPTRGDDTSVIKDVPIVDIKEDRVQQPIDRRVQDLYLPAFRSQEHVRRTKESNLACDFPIALMIDAIWPEPDRDAGSLLIMSQLDAIKRLGYQVIFSPTVDADGFTTYREALTQAEILCPTGELVENLEDFIANYGEILDLVILSRVTCGGYYYEKIREHAPRAKVVFSPVDLHGVREIRAGEVNADIKTVNKARALLERELYLTRNSEATMVVSDIEGHFLQRRVPGANIYTTPVLTHQDRPVPGFSERGHVIGFIGNFGHLPNIDAVEVLVREIWPTLSTYEPGLRLQIVGQSLPKTILDILPPGVEYLGHVENIELWLASIKATVAPLRFGAGAKGKIVTSLSAGVPCIATEIGVEGMGLVPNRDIVIAANVDDFVTGLLAIVNDQVNWERLSYSAVEKMRADYSPGVVLATWHEMLSSIGAPCELGGMSE